MSEAEIAEVKQKADDNDKYVFDMPVEVKDAQGNVIAKVNKTLYVRKKRQAT